MSCTLSGADLQRLQEAEAALLSIGRRVASPESWCERVVERVAALFRSEWTLFAVRHRQGLSMECRPESRRLESAVDEVLDASASGETRRGGRGEAGRWRSRPRRFHIWTCRDARPANGSGADGQVLPVARKPIGASPLADASLLPEKAVDGGGLSAGLPQVTAVLCAAPGYPGTNPFGRAWLDLARLLRPAFEASVRILQRHQCRHGELLRAFDDMSRPILVADRGRGAVHRNGALERLLSRCTDPGALLDEVGALARCVSLMGRSDPETMRGETADVEERKVTVGERAYHLRALPVAAGVVTPGRATVVEVAETTPTLPSERDLQRRFGLTPRESEVVLLLARGATNREAGEALGISPHTVRSHAQRIFRKLDVTTRKALALRLLGDGDRDRAVATGC